ncbi:hypothetical protein [Blautia sp. MSJ-9]|uniref:hypothetical protein n=1 Tax=Blautia sp. MSJ-9 TaxID=2841511 RepID=UPI001C113ACC|nr:hypothetical protein [Blautia sp. MSJ-9]MBU5681361.1 hypothetical protein [Blautia sp. MSJ-9]
MAKAKKGLYKTHGFVYYVYQKVTACNRLFYEVHKKEPDRQQQYVNYVISRREELLLRY